MAEVISAAGHEIRLAILDYLKEGEQCVCDTPSMWRPAGLDGVGERLRQHLRAFMYFATFTEVPILQGLIAAGMGNGPALALLLAGPALSLPSMLVIRSTMGTRKTLVFFCRWP